MKTQINELRKQTMEARERLIQTINSLPEADDGVTMISRNCCVVPFSLIGRNGILSPSYYMSIESKKALIAAIVVTRNLDTMVKTIDDVLETGSIKGIKISANILMALQKAWENE